MSKNKNPDKKINVKHLLSVEKVEPKVLEKTLYNLRITKKLFFNMVDLKKIRWVKV